MSRHQDCFSAFTTAKLRNVLVANCERGGASRANRPELVQKLLTTLQQEEIRMVERAARCSLEDIGDPQRFLPAIHRTLRDRFGSLLDPYLVHPSRRLRVQQPVRLAAQPEVISDGDLWPQPISEATKDRCMQEFIDRTNIALGPTCAVCSRRTFDRDLLFTKQHVACARYDIDDVDLSVLQVCDPHLLALPSHHFEYDDDRLNGLALERSGIFHSGSRTELDICNTCHDSLSQDPPLLPSLALANDNVRGTLPPHLQDCTWLEERLCAKYLASAAVIRLYDFSAPGAPLERPRVMKGHTCAFPLNTISTATKLPWTLDGEGALLSCIVIGPRKPRLQDLRHVFTVRRRKVLQLFEYLRANFKDYPQFSIDEDALNSLPDDDVPELIMRHVVYQASEQVPSLFAEETAGLDAHPALEDNAEEDDLLSARTFLEHHGTLDVNGYSVPAHHRLATALTNAKGTERPDLVIRHGTECLNEYNNPGLLPGLYPTLFPWGTGGFEVPRRTSLNFDKQAQYLLDLHDPAFRRHWSFLFVIANMKHRRAVQRGAFLTCKNKHFKRFAATLSSISPAAVKSVADHIAQGGSLSSLVGEETRIFSLLKQCEIASLRVPGSRSIMTRARSDIRGYIGKFGIFQLFLTLNPSPTHSPVFHIFYGDRSVRLETRRPNLPSCRDRAIRVADDPVSASDYFHFHVAAVFRFLLGWDVRTMQSTTEGGILGHLQAYVLVKEHTMRGQLHCHCLLWLKGGLNPAALRSRMRSDEEFQERFFTFFDDLISHGYPPGYEPPSNRDEAAGVDERESNKKRFPRQERPPQPSQPDYADAFRDDLLLLLPEVQTHKHTASCFKGGRSSCRYLFPVELVPRSFFDAATSSIWLRVLHAWVNWYNPLLLVAVRHNIDLKFVFSGKSGSAVASYITQYATKSDETPANQASMINAVFERMALQALPTTDAKSLLVKCVMHFGRERQLHAQQACTYVRDLGDVEQSHVTVAMLSNQLIRTAAAMFGPVRQDEYGQDEKDADVHASSASAPTLDDVPVPPSGTEAFPPDGKDDDSGDEEDDQDGDITGDFRLPLNTKGLPHQVEDYLHRGPALAEFNFYTFVGYVRLFKMPKEPNKTHHTLAPTHRNKDTHVHKYSPSSPVGIPRPICARFPRRDGTSNHGDEYCLAMLAHFLPFSPSQPLKSRSETWEDAFRRAEFSPAALATMANWDALSECEDERDAEQLQRRRMESNLAVRTEGVVGGFDPGEGSMDNPNADIDIEAVLAKSKEISVESALFSQVLKRNGWFDLNTGAASPAVAEETVPTASPRNHAQRSTWRKEQDALFAKAAADLCAPTATTGILAEQLKFSSDAPETATAATFVDNDGSAPATIHLQWNDLRPDQLLDALVKERGLTSSQALAFTIAGRRFFEQFHGTYSLFLRFWRALTIIFIVGVSSQPLRLLMHGEAGTGKTVVVRLLRELMARHGRGAEMLLVAPTGKAATAIGGMTQHAAFSLDVSRRNLTTEELESTGQQPTARRQRKLQDTLCGVQWIFFDEVSMTSCEMLADIDQALRIGKQMPNEPFGGVNVLFAGDLCQLPPVAAAALYVPLPRRSLPSDVRSKSGLGRLVWMAIDEVVEFKEQMRMQDSDMAAALSRLRLRQCTEEDVDLFNSNVLTTHGKPNAAVRARSDLIVLAPTNLTVRLLNQRKAAAEAASDGKTLVISHAADKSPSIKDLSTREALLNFNGQRGHNAPPGRLPLFVGMPIVYRGPNLSVALGVTNGAFGTVKAWELLHDSYGKTTPVVAIVELDSNATWCLSGLSPGCLPIYPTSSTFTYNTGLANDTVHRISRRQLPLQPGFAMTVHSAQGITSQGGVIVDLRRGGFHTYVAASRATRREHVFLLAPVTKNDLNCPALPVALEEELVRLQELAQASRDRHGHSNWRLHPIPATTAISQPDSVLLVGEPPTKRMRTS